LSTITKAEDVIEEGVVDREANLREFIMISAEYMNFEAYAEEKHRLNDCTTLLYMEYLLRKLALGIDVQRWIAKVRRFA